MNSEALCMCGHKYDWHPEGFACFICKYNCLKFEEKGMEVMLEVYQWYEPSNEWRYFGEFNPYKLNYPHFLYINPLGGGIIKIVRKEDHK